MRERHKDFAKRGRNGGMPAGVWPVTKCGEKVLYIVAPGDLQDLTEDMLDELWYYGHKQNFLSLPYEMDFPSHEC
jgi:hypothetical protein